MSELKAINAYQLTTNTEDSDVFIHNDEFGCGGDLVECYLKSEADKVIAELKEKHKTKVKELLCLIRDKENNFNRAFDAEEKEIRHHKYKRCLAMARWCKQRYDAVDYRIPIRKWDFYKKWLKRWLELAEKFKEINNDCM